jgi:hypothetical protein
MLDGCLFRALRHDRPGLTPDARADEVRVVIDRHAPQERESGTAGHDADQPPEHGSGRRQRERPRRQLRQRHSRSLAGRLPHLILLGGAERERRHAAIVQPARASVYVTSLPAQRRQQPQRREDSTGDHPEPERRRDLIRLWLDA